MAPVSSRIAEPCGVKTVPLVPSETTTSPGWRVRPSAAPMLSPVPAATRRPWAVPPAAGGEEARGGAAGSGGGREHVGDLEVSPEGPVEQVEPVVAVGGRPVAGAG